MPITQVVFYQDADGRAPVREWLRELRRRDAPMPWPKAMPARRRTSSGRSNACDACSRIPEPTSTKTRVTMPRKKTRNALELIARDVGPEPGFRARVEEEKFNAQVARMVLEARTAAGLTQQELADLARTTQPVIARLEDADYEGHSLRMLRRIARALNRSLEIRLVAD